LLDRLCAHFGSSLLDSEPDCENDRNIGCHNRKNSNAISRFPMSGIAKSLR
jgi:hypothetical protein